MMAGAAYADPIEGNWKTDKGSTAAISACGGSFCIKLKTGTHAGKSIGKFKSNGGQQLFRQDHRPGQRQDLYRKGDALRQFAQDERLRASAV